MNHRCRLVGYSPKLVAESDRFIDQCAGIETELVQVNLVLHSLFLAIIANWRPSLSDHPVNSQNKHKHKRFRAAMAFPLPTADSARWRPPAPSAASDRPRCTFPSRPPVRYSPPSPAGRGDPPRKIAAKNQRLDFRVGDISRRSSSLRLFAAPPPAPPDARPPLRAPDQETILPSPD